MLKKIATWIVRRMRLLNYGKTVQRTIDGLTYELCLSENIDNSLYYFGYYEKETTRLLDRLLPADGVVVEVGANIGAHTLSMGKQLLAGGGQVYAFEPTSYACGRLMRNLELNDLPNVHPFRMALSDENGESDLECATSDATMPFKASWDIKGGTRNRQADHIVFMRMDDWVEQNGIERLDLLKIDVDGYEMKVLGGAAETLKRFRPVIVIELGITVERVGGTVEGLIAMLHDAGYSIRSADDKEEEYDDATLAQKVRETRTLDCLCRPK